jgi:HemX protein
VLDWFQQPGGVSAAKLVVTILVWVGYLVAAWLRWRGRLVAQSYAWSCVALFVLAIISLWPVEAGHHAPANSPTPAPGTSNSSLSKPNG